VDPHSLGIALGPPFAAVVLEVANQFLFLGVHRDRRLVIGQGRLYARADMDELSIAIKAIRAFAVFAVGLQAEIQPLQ
jgi:hypothetical protein